MTPEQEQKRLELTREREALIVEKLEHQTSLTALKNKVRSSGRLPTGEYRSLCNQQTHHLRCVLDIERKLGPLNQKLREMQAADFLTRKPAANGSSSSTSHHSLIAALREVRDKWQEIACDDFEHGPTERLLASQFVRDLNPIVRKLCEP